VRGYQGIFAWLAVRQGPGHRPTCCRPPGMFMYRRFCGQYPLLPPTDSAERGGAAR
jgi:hypothetical protein